MTTNQLGSVVYMKDFYGCDLDALKSLTKENVDGVVTGAGFDLMGSVFVPFGEGVGAISYAAIISESGVSVVYNQTTIHTAPENGCVEILIHTCVVEGTGAVEPPNVKAQRVFNEFERILKPTWINDLGETSKANLANQQPAHMSQAAVGVQ